MKNVSVVEAKAKFSAWLAEVEAGEEIAVTRHGKVVARLMPANPPMAVEAFRDMWRAEKWDIQAPADSAPETVASLDE